MKIQFNDSAINETAENLFFAAGHNDLAQVKALHEQGIDLTMKNGQALQIAVLAQHPQMVTLLLNLSFKKGCEHYIAQAVNTANKINANSQVLAALGKETVQTVKNTRTQPKPDQGK